MSYIAVKSEELKKLAKGTIDRVDRDRQERWDALVDHVLSEQVARTKTWLGRLLRRKVPSREDVDASLKGDGLYTIDEYEIIFSSYERQRQAAVRLLNACEAADVVQVSVDDYWWVT